MSGSPEAQVSAGNVRAEGRTHRAAHQNHDLFLKHISRHSGRSSAQGIQSYTHSLNKIGKHLIPSYT